MSNLMIYNYLQSYSFFESTHVGKMKNAPVDGRGR